MMNDKTPRSKREIQSFSDPDTVRLSVPYPKPGQTLQVEFERYGLSLLIERREKESQEQLRRRFVVTAPVGEDNRTHAARMGTGAVKPKKMGVTLCTEHVAASKASGTRIAGLTLDSVTCSRCRAALGREGVEINGASE